MSPASSPLALVLPSAKPGERVLLPSFAGSADALSVARLREAREGLLVVVVASATDARRIARHPSAEIESILGYIDEPEMIHRDNLVLSEMCEK